MRHPCEHSPSLRQILLLLCALCPVVGLWGCYSAQTGTYMNGTVQARNPLEAQRLTQRAAATMSEDPESAEDMLREALRADLYHGPAHNNLGVLLLSKGDLYGAANEFEWARKLMPGHPDPRLNLAVTLERAGQKDEAMKTYQTALDVYPGYIPAIEAVTRLMLRHGSTRGGDERSNSAREELHANLSEIALRGSSEEWRQWAVEQLARMGR